jgi:hypothetical protein
MGFPWLLLGGLAAGVPVALHFFFRSRYRVVPWAAMEFLLTSIQTTSRRLKFQELLLLLLRIDLLLLLAVALAQPLLGGGNKVGPQSLDVVLVIDNSYSMGAREPVTGQTRLELAKKEAVEVIKGLETQPGSTVKVVVCSDRAEILGPTNPADHAAAIKLVEGIRLSHKTTDFYDGFGKAEEALKNLADRAHPNKEREVYLFSDQRWVGWERQRDGVSQRARDLRKETEGRQTRLVLVRCGTEDLTNAAVVDLRQPDGPLFAGEDAAFQITVRNTGPKKITQLKVALFVDDRQAPDEPVIADEKHPLEPNHERKVSVKVALPTAGPHLVTATTDPARRRAKRDGATREVPTTITGVDRAGKTLTVLTEDGRTETVAAGEAEVIGPRGNVLSRGVADESVKADQRAALLHDPADGKLKRVYLPADIDDLGLDNSRDLIVQVRTRTVSERTRVLLVEGVSDDDQDRSASFYLRQALQPVPVIERDKYRVQVQTIVPRQARPELLDNRDVVILTDVPAKPLLDANETEQWHKFLARLESFVANGGGLMIFCGPRVDPHDYNRLLGYCWWRGKRTLLPAHFLERYSPPDNQLLYGNPDSVPEDSYLRRFRREKVYRELLLNEFAFIAQAMKVEEWPEAADHKLSSVDLRFGDGNPAIVSRTVGKGRVILCTTTSGLRWTVWPKAGPLWLPLVQLSLAHLVGGDAGESQGPTFTFRTGDPLEWKLEGDARDRVHTVLTPDGDKVLPQRRDEDGGRTVHVEFSRTNRAGIYTLQRSDGKTEGVTNLDPRSGQQEPASRAVNLKLAQKDPDHPGDLERFDIPSESDLNTLLGKDNLVQWTAGRANRHISEARPPENRPLTPWLLGALAGLFVAELFLAWVCSRSMANESAVWTVTLLVLIGLVVLQMIALVVGAVLVWRWPGLLS